MASTLPKTSLFLAEDISKDYSFRPACISDYEAVMRLCPNYFNGLDYLPAKYREIVTNSSNYGATVAEFENQIVRAFQI